MNLEAIWAEIEEDQKWRTDEIRFLSNQLATLSSEEDRNRFRRATILLLYSHFEGFCKFAFIAYVTALNGEFLTCKEVNVSLAASSLAEFFDTLRNPNKKSDIFRNTLPEDAKLHSFARNKEFVERMQFYEDHPMIIPDSVIDTESNLKPVVLKKILYLLGFDYEAFKNVEGNIHDLLQWRNKIAHGQTKAGIDEPTYTRLSTSTFNVMNEIKSFIMVSLTNKTYLRTIA